MVLLRLRLLAVEVLGNRNRLCGRWSIRVKASLLLCVAAPLAEAVSGSIHNAVRADAGAARWDKKPNQTRPGRGRDWGAGQLSVDGARQLEAWLVLRAEMRHGLLEGRVRVGGKQRGQSA